MIHPKWYNLVPDVIFSHPQLPISSPATSCHRMVVSVLWRGIAAALMGILSYRKQKCFFPSVCTSIRLGGDWRDTSKSKTIHVLRPLRPETLQSPLSKALEPRGWMSVSIDVCVDIIPSFHRTSLPSGLLTKKYNSITSKLTYWYIKKYH